jgi:hypothetical protein
VKYPATRSQIIDNGTNVGIGVINPIEKLSISAPFTTVGNLHPIITSQLNSGIQTGGIYSVYESSSPFASGLAFKTYKSNVGFTDVVRILNNGSIQGITEHPSENSVKLASTAWVKNQSHTIGANSISSISGTPNQVIASVGTGAVSLSLPQSIATNSTPTFGGLEIISSTIASTPAPVMTSLQKIKIANPSAGQTVYCSDCLANDGSTGVTQTYNGKQWKNHW